MSGRLLISWVSSFLAVVDLFPVLFSNTEVTYVGSNQIIEKAQSFWDRVYGSRHGNSIATESRELHE